jgi:hypothetical protein
MKRMIIIATAIAMGMTGTAFASEATPDSLTLKGGEKGTTFGSLLIEGEDRVRVTFERPTLELNLDPRTAPGLEWEGIFSALARGGVNTLEPMWATTAARPPQVYVHPWMQAFQHGNVARFRPALDNVARWSLNVASPTGDTVARFAGDGKPPKEIAWDGRTTDGELAPPGYTYSYVLEAYDKAGNKRTFVGEGFELSAYRVETADGVVLMIAGDDVTTNESATAALLETATWINRSALDQPVEVRVRARTFADGQRTAEHITAALQPLLLGNPLRVQTSVDVETDAPGNGTVAIHIGK